MSPRFTSWSSLSTSQGVEGHIGCAVHRREAEGHHPAFLCANLRPRKAAGERVGEWQVLSGRCGCGHAPDAAGGSGSGCEGLEGAVWLWTGEQHVCGLRCFLGGESAHCALSSDNCCACRHAMGWRMCSAGTPSTATGQALRQSPLRWRPTTPSWSGRSPAQVGPAPPACNDDNYVCELYSLASSCLDHHAAGISRFARSCRWHNPKCMAQVCWMWTPASPGIARSWPAWVSSRTSAACTARCMGTLPVGPMACAACRAALQHHTVFEPRAHPHVCGPSELLGWACAQARAWTV